MLFFAQRVEEMLMFYTSHIYKVPICNAYTLIEEYIQTYSLVTSGSVNSANLSAILDEFYDTLAHDIIIKAHYSDEDIACFTSLLKGSQPVQQEKFMRYLKHTMRDYPSWCIEEAEKFVPNHPESKKDIDKLLRSLVPILIAEGYHPNYIYWECRHIFSSSSINDTSALETFLSRFDSRERNYVVYFAVDKCVEEFTQILQTMFGVSFQQDKYSKRVNKYSMRLCKRLKLDSKKYICVHMTVKTLDRGTAAELAYNTFSIFMSYYKFLGNRSGDWCLDKALVLEENGIAFGKIDLKPHRDRYSWNYDHKTLGRNAQRIITALLNNTACDDREKLDRMITNHNLALDTPSARNSFLNLWSVLEIIGVSDNNNAKISEVMDSIMPILKRNYVRLIFKKMHDYLKANIHKSEYRSFLESISENGDDVFKIACAVILEKYDVLRNKLYNNQLAKYPLIRSRMHHLNADIFCSKKALLKELDRYERRLRRHIQRLYRTRNAIVHAGEKPVNLKYLSEHLHDYADEIMIDILETLTGDNSLGTVNNVIINAQVFMKKIYEDYKRDKSDKAEPFTEKDIRLLLSS